MKKRIASDEFYQQAFSIVQVLIENDDSPEFKVPYYYELTKLNDIIKNLPDGDKYESFSDLHSFFENLPKICNKSYEDINRQEMKNTFDTFFLILQILMIFILISETNAIFKMSLL